MAERNELMADPEREGRCCLAADMISFQSTKLTVQDVAKALGTEQLLQTSHFFLQVTHQLVVGILIDDSIAFDVLSSVSVAKKTKNKKQNPKT